MTKIAAVEIQVAPVADTPYLRIMKVWASWISLTDRQHAGGWSHPQDAKEFMCTGEAVDVMVNDLPRVGRWAIHKANGIAPGVWRFPDTSFADSLMDAEAALLPKMRNNINTRRYFG